MAELIPPDSIRCNYFFLYDGSKVKGEADPTRDGICYFYPEETPLDKQELLCGQLAGVGRCVSELSSSPVRILRLRRSKYAIRMKDNFFWALGCSVDVPTITVSQLLDQLINLFCFYNGSVQQSYQLHSRETLAARWAKYLSHLKSEPSELQHIFSCLRTIDSTNVDPLLLLKAALILQACQRCPLVLAGCILFRGRVVSTQMSPELTMKVMVHESETYSETQSRNGPSNSSLFDSAVSSTTVFLTLPELQYLQSAPVDKDLSSHSTPHKDATPKKTRLSRTLSDMASTDSDSTEPDFIQSSQKMCFSSCFSEADNSMFSPALSQSTTKPLNLQSQSLKPSFSNGKNSKEAGEETVDESYYSIHSSGGGGSRIHGEEDGSAFKENSHLNGAGGDGDGDIGFETIFDIGGVESGIEESHDYKAMIGDCSSKSAQGPRTQLDPAPSSGAFDNQEESPLIPMTLYLHRVKSLVLALLVEPHFLSDKASMEEVYHSSLASLNGLEAHLRTISPVAPGAPGPYIFAHFDRIQSTLTTNLSGRPGGAQEHPFVRATSLLHSHFCNTETLQEAIIRSAGAAVYVTSSVAHETYFQQNGGSLRNSGIPNHQDSAFSLPSKARHRLLKHGVNLL
ncbi:Hermansky-Pudlak syndrome 4 protein Light-ear protein -like protein [Channa argus]|uniref:Hermansky-Pudlak syndrome 4 protein Light-ear protein-like protein n=1 Tax=Channa argus TaxID=215402 RepID=A0A6G1Q0N6_CHAAH|nr:Hermansky-Pudlak syndrome 4 protein Light-ear protein -like protein [Channa argus]